MKNSYYSILALLLGFIITNEVFAQFTPQQQSDNPPCGTGTPSQQWIDWMNEKVEDYKQRNRGSRSVNQYTIPIVFHIIHGGQAVGTFPNLTAAQIESQIEVLNADFSGTGTNYDNVPGVFESLVANTGIQFCMATIDPEGNVMTEPGIDRVNYNDLNGVANPNTISNTNSFAQDYLPNDLKPATIWDPTKYLNVWVTDKHPQMGLFGAATFPAASGLTGTFPAQYQGTATDDGFWCWSKVVGNVGFQDPTYGGGRVATHELGHYMGLFHIWGDSNCATDYCDDTPPAQTSNTGCPSHPHNQGGCSGNTTGEMYMNFMDYSDGSCMAMFTPDQTARMQTVMENGTYRKDLGTHGLCNLGPQLPVAVFETDYKKVCSGENIQYTDLSHDSITNWSWTFEGGSPSTSSNQHPLVTYNAPGNYNSTLIVTNNNGTDTLTITITVGGANAPSANNDSRCGPGIVNLSVDSVSNTSYYWYDTANGGNLLQIGDNYSPNITTTSTYYVEAISAPQKLYLDPTDNTMGDGGYFNTNDDHGLVFDVNSDILLKSVLVYANDAGDRTFELLDGLGGTTIYSEVKTLTAGQQRVNLDWNIPSGSGYFIKITGNVNLYRNSTGANYPYEIPDVISITGSDISNQYPTYYYFFYDWEIEIESSCPSERVAVTGTINNSLNISLTSTDITCFGESNGSITSSISGGQTPYSYLWSNGSNNASLSNLVAATYSVSVIDDAGCTSFESIQLEQPEEIMLTITSTDATCGQSNGSASIAASGGSGSFNYNWSNGSSASTISNLSANTYSVSITDANSCNKLASVNINSSNGPTIDLEITDVNCFGGSSGSILATISNGTSPYVIIWSNGSVNALNENLSKGQYNLTVTDNNNCSSNATAFIDEPSQINLTTNSAPATCGANNGSATVNASGGEGTFTYSWNNGANTPSITGLPSNNYLVTVTDGNGCKESKSVNVGNSNGPSITFQTSNPTCYGGSNGDITAIISGGSSPYTIFWSNGASGDYANNLIADTYTISVTDNNGCSSNSSVTLSNPDELLLTVSGNSTTCGENNGSASSTVTGGTGTISYLWNNGANSNAIAGLVAGTYTVEVQDAKGCSQFGTVTVNPSSSPEVTLEVADISCFGKADGSIIASVSGGITPYSIAWNNGKTDLVNENLISGNYGVTITDSIGCSVSSDAFVDEPNEIELSTTSTPATCGQNNGSATAIATGGSGSIKYLWSNGNNSNSIENVAANVYHITVSDSNNCLKIASVNVTNSGAATLSLVHEDVTCYAYNDGAISTTITGGQSPFTYNWSNGSTGKDLSNLDAGIFSLTLTDNQGCVTTNQVEIMEPEAISVTINTVNATCGQQNGAASVYSNGGTGVHSYLWSNGSTQATIQNLSAGIYSATISDDNGCQQYASTSVTGQGNHFINVIANDVSCFNGSDGEIYIEVHNGSSPYTYNWHDGNVNNARLNLTAGNYIVTVFDANQCPLIADIDIKQPDEIIIDISVTDAVCLPDNGAIYTSISGGTPPYIYNWNNGSNNSYLEDITPGNYQVIVTDINDCFATAKPLVKSLGELDFRIDTKSTSCSQTNDGMASVQIVSGTSPFIYQWNDNNFQTTKLATGLASGIYEATVTDANGCIATENGTVNQTTDATLTIDKTDALCNTSVGSIEIEVLGGHSPYTYAWSNGANSSEINQVTPAVYSVTVADNKNCTYTTSIEILNKTTGELNSTITEPTCIDSNNGSIETVVTGGNPPFVYNWSNGVSTNIATGLDADSYEVTITDASFCQLKKEYTLESISNLYITATSAPNTSTGDCNGATGANAVNGVPPYSFQWNDSEMQTTQIATGLCAGTYQVSVVDAVGCTAVYNQDVDHSVSINDLVDENTFNIHPNPFSNHTTIINYKSNNKITSIKVLNSLGQIVLTHTNILMNETTLNLENLPSGAYLVAIETDKQNILKKVIKQ